MEVMMSRETALFLLNLLNAQTLNVGAPDFEQAVTAIVAARAELLALVAENTPVPA